MSETNNFLIHKHKTANPHYDFYLQLGDQLWSWIIPNGIPTSRKDKKVAIQNELFDRSINEVDSEKEAEDCYGAGQVETWDKGSFEVDTSKNIKIIIEAKGEKLNGKYLLHVPNWGRWTRKRLWTIEKIR